VLPSARTSRQQDQNINKTSLITVLLLFATMAGAVEMEAPAVLLSGVPATIELRGAIGQEVIELTAGDSVQVVVADEQGSASIDIVFPSSGAATLVAMTESGASATASVRILPGWGSVTPPLLAIIVALTLRNVIPALMLGIWLGAAALQSFTPTGIFRGLLDAFEIYVVRALADRDHAAIILFSMMVGGMVGIVTRNGGMARIVTMMVSRARTAVAGQISVWLMGLMIFFDDYSNTLVVGNTARPLTDHLRISREKLAYIVDSTAAPVVCLALITTWIGYQVGLIDAALGAIPDLDEPAYTVFLRSIPYSFYPILAVVFVLAVAATGRDMGPMYHAELRARRGQVSPGNAAETPALQGDQLEPKADIPMRAVNAFVPLAVLIVALIVGLYMTGEGDSLTDIIGSADAYRAMMWASLLGAMTAGVMTVGQRILTTHETVDAWFGGVRAMLFAMIILILAWSLSNVTEDLHTADYLVTILADSLRPELVPAAVFLLSAITAFTTGTSWGTMGILMPLVVPLCWAVLDVNGMADPAHLHILYSAIACNLAGAVWGDHCSPISDTTVLSSMASGCDHIEHVRTQMPYAVLVGIVAMLLGTIPGGFGFSPLLSLLLGSLLLMVVLRYYGNRADDEA